MTSEMTGGAVRPGTILTQEINGYFTGDITGILTTDSNILISTRENGFAVRL
jgi:hypothetical protein